MNAPAQIQPNVYGEAKTAPARPAMIAMQRRETALVRFAMAITTLNILGHLWLGFEQSWITPFVALAAAYSTEIAGETALARSLGRKPRYAGGRRNFVMFMLSAHITGLAVGMLLYAAEQLWAVAFAASAAVASKYVFRVKVGPQGATRHFLNPSNFGIAITLVLFPTVGIAQPYQFAENITGAVDWLLPLVIVMSGSLLNGKLTLRMPLIGGWLAGFAAQAAIRAAIFGTPLVAGLAPMTGFAFVLFTFYMVTDPATTPEGKTNQRIFGASVAAVYGVLMTLHVVFGLFFALVIVTAIRGLSLPVMERYKLAAERRAPVLGAAPTYAE